MGWILFGKQQKKVETEAEVEKSKKMRTQEDEVVYLDKKRPTGGGWGRIGERLLQFFLP
jgi:hypothetical protein